MTGEHEPLREGVVEWIGEILGRLEFVEWDRFTVNHDEQAGEIVNVYGWIERRRDEYKDFVVVRFFPDTEDSLIWYLTSSDKYTEEICRRIYGHADDHNPCRRVEDEFEVENAVELGDQTTLADGGRHTTEADQ